VKTKPSPPTHDRVAPSAEGSIRVAGVSRSFKGVPVLDHVSLEVRSGQIGALVGPNGAGKTTLLRIIAGILEPDNGTVSVAGRPPGKGSTGYVVAGDRGLYWRLTAVQNLEFFAGVAGFTTPAARENAWRVLRALGAADLAERRVEVCSTGQRRRIAVARGFVGLPPVVLVDEPFADLDDEGCRAVESLIRSWAESGGCVLYAAPMLGVGPAADVLFELSRDGRGVKADALAR
jgi:ABC-2 type transport system ATP-binding protein